MTFGRDEVVRVGKDLIISSHLARKEVPNRNAHSLRMSVGNVVLRRDTIRLAFPRLNNTAEYVVLAQEHRVCGVGGRTEALGRLTASVCKSGPLGGLRSRSSQ